MSEWAHKKRTLMGEGESELKSVPKLVSRLRFAHLQFKDIRLLGGISNLANRYKEAQDQATFIKTLDISAASARMRSFRRRAVRKSHLHATQRAQNLI